MKVHEQCLPCMINQAVKTANLTNANNREEALYNALIHSCWASGVPIQVRIEDDAMYISNDCVFPSDWTKETLLQRHRSRPYNPCIANAFLELVM